MAIPIGQALLDNITAGNVIEYLIPDTGERGKGFVRKRRGNMLLRLVNVSVIRDGQVTSKPAMWVTVDRVTTVNGQKVYNECLSEQAN